MFKKLLVAILIALPMMVAAQAPKFGIVRPADIIQAMPEYTAMQTQLETSNQTFQAEAKKIEDEITTKYTEFQQLQQQGTTPENILQRRVQEIQDLKTKGEQFVISAQQDLQRQQAQLMQPINEKFLAAVKAVGQENGFTMIFEEAVSLYTGADVVDVTPLVRAKLGIAATTTPAPAK